MRNQQHRARALCAGSPVGRFFHWKVAHRSPLGRRKLERHQYVITGAYPILLLRSVLAPPRKRAAPIDCSAFRQCRNGTTGVTTLASRIEEYALLGDTQTAALVARDGSIDWLCWPRFDSPACFAALLGRPEHGRWLLAPSGEILRTTRRYRGDTLILETDLETRDGAVTLIDFMPPRGSASDLVRIVVGRRGRVQMHTQLIIRFDYGIAIPWVSRREDGALHAVAGPDALVLRTPAPLRGEDLRTAENSRSRQGRESHSY
jgi:hypothetical protein